jgi:hypothetical protein
MSRFRKIPSGQMLDDIRWQRMFGSRFSENGEDVTDNWFSNQFTRARHYISARERQD